VSACDAIVIGAGLTGATLALKLKLKLKHGHARVLLIERETELLARASRFNQARLHGGYHYPRSFDTAARSRRNLAAFAARFGDALLPDLTHYYAIARVQSQISPAHFERFCRAIHAPLERADDALPGVLDRTLIQALYRVDEPAFDADRLRGIVRDELDAAGVEMWFSAHVQSISVRSGGLTVQLADGRTNHAPRVYNATYAALDQFESALAPELKREDATLLLIDPPQALNGAALTVMDGPFFSLMPFPPAQAWTLSHVRYTPSDFDSIDAWTARVQRDLARWAPGLGALRPRGHWTERKAVLKRHELDDGRPPLKRASATLPGLVHVLGAKIDAVCELEP
jgi:glycine/D-amino acid oxidase-like deaminating enzyme